jgi:hypothetical protein
VSELGQQASVSGEQFYVTHCNVADSVLNNPGYTVRAASANAPALLDAAFHYPPYELPIDMWKELPTPEHAPRRLARTHHAKGGVWCVQSAYLAKDTVARDRSYFSHLLLLPAADTLAVLRSWGADEWITSYAPGAPKQLASRVTLPVGHLVSDEALTEFLNDDPTGPTELGLTVCPARLRDSTTERRELFARMLRAVMLLAEQSTDTRRRLYIHAEPGLVAMLLYGAFRLLPQNLHDDVPFSTFEAYHRNIRDYKLADIVGTYLGSPDRTLDPDLGTTRGFAFDTFTPNRSSPELRTASTATLPPGVNELLELAIRGEWHLLPTVKQAIGPDARGLPKAGAAIVRARGLARVDAGEATIEDLLALQSDKTTATELKSRADRVWPVVKAAALTRSDVRTTFRDLLAEPARVKELFEEALDGLLKEDYSRWSSRWAVIRATAGTEEAKRLLNKMVGSEKNEARLAKLPTETRNALRSACADVGLFPSRAMLVPVGLGELETLLNAQPEWAGYTAFVAMADDKWNWLAHIPATNREAMRTRARAYLHAAPPGAIAAYVHAARPFLDNDSKFLDVLFTPYSESGAALMDKLLVAGTLEPGDWLKLCESVGLTHNAWGDFLLENNRLAKFLIGLGGDGVGRELWDAYLSLLTPALISPDLLDVEGADDATTIYNWERKVHENLRAAAAEFTARDVRLVQALPQGGVARLFAANSLVKWADNPATIPADAIVEVPHACDTFEVERGGFVRAAFKHSGLFRLPLPERAAELAPIVELFRVCFPVDANYNTARRAATEVIRLSELCPVETRGAFQSHVIFGCIPDIHYANLLNEQRQQPFDPVVVAYLHSRLARPAQATPPRYTPPAPVAPAPAAPVDEPFENEPEPAEESEPVIESKRGRKNKYKKPKKSGCAGMLVFLLFVVVTCAILVRNA